MTRFPRLSGAPDVATAAAEPVASRARDASRLPAERRAVAPSRARRVHGTVRIGISGWRYTPWRGVFYPQGLQQRRELEFASRQVASIEINGSFYSLQPPAAWQSWRDETPDDFVFSVKGPRFITHMKKLIEPRVPLANFLASGVLSLGPKLGPILWQLPPQLAFDPARLSAFAALLPRDTDSAAALAAAHDHRVEKSGTWYAKGPCRPLRHAIEVRHPSFASPEFVALLRREAIGLVVADTAHRWPLLEDLTADFVYVRLHGDEELYASGYADDALSAWARRIAAWRAGSQVEDARTASPEPPRRLPRRDVYCYFDNDIKVHAPFDAMRLVDRLAR